jgi:hypothetical protein
MEEKIANNTSKTTIGDIIRPVIIFFKLRIMAIRSLFQKKSNIQSWAELEIKKACEYERMGDGIPEGEWDYGCACHESAFRAYKSLLKDGHSGFSIKMTQRILNRLIDCKPLTPIFDTDDVWEDISDISGLKGEKVNYQCKRMSSLFKYVYADGTVKYSNNDYCYCIDIINRSTYHSGLVSCIIHEMYPITMPYMPGEPIKVCCEDILTDKKNGDFDTVAIYYCIMPNGERVEIERYFKESSSDNGWDEITKEEFDTRKALADELKKEVNG